MRAGLSNLLFRVFGWLFASLFVWYFAVLLFGSAAPEPASGSTYEVNLHGTKIYVGWFAYYLQYLLFFGGLICGLLASLISPREHPPPTDFTFSRYPITAAVAMICFASGMISMMVGFWLGPSQAHSEIVRVLETIAYVGVAGFMLSILSILWRENRNRPKSD